MNHQTSMGKKSASYWLILIGIGLVAGFLSGLFGVGGGILIVPALTNFLHFSPKLAAGTSLATIVPLATVGVISYATHGSVSWVGALLLAAGAMVGAQIGTWLLSRISPRRLQLIFAGFIIIAIVSMFIAVPSRDANLEITVWVGIALVAVGALTGVLSGLLGVGGGIVVVPALMLIFGASDLIAKGTSLLMMIPAALSGTFGNYRRDNVRISAALTLGGGACVTTAFGATLAKAIDPLTSNILFSVFLAVVACRMVWQALQAKKQS